MCGVARSWVGLARSRQQGPRGRSLVSAARLHETKLAASSDFWIKNNSLDKVTIYYVRRQPPSPVGSCLLDVVVHETGTSAFNQVRVNLLQRGAREIKAPGGHDGTDYSTSNVRGSYAWCTVGATHLYGHHCGVCPEADPLIYNGYRED